MEAILLLCRMITAEGKYLAAFEFNPKVMGVYVTLARVGSNKKPVEFCAITSNNNDLVDLTNTLKGILKDG